MESYIVPIQTAFFVFPAIAFLFTIPYMIYEYRKFGAIPAFRTLIIYSIILYLISAYFLVILPLPPVGEVVRSTAPRMQMIPFQFILDIIRESSLVVTKPSTYLKALGDPAIYQVLYNIVLLFPFGFFLRYYFKYSWIKTIIYSFLLSLFFELTQLSGLYGMYPRSYRLFDVDDLLINTIGGAMGYLFTPIISAFLPSRDKLDQISYERGKQISYSRRLYAFGLDWLLIIITCPILITLLHQVFNFKFSGIIQYAIIISFYFVLVPMLLKGQTLGKKFFKMKLIRTDKHKVSSENYIVRYGILYFFLVPSPIIFLIMLHFVPLLSFPILFIYLVVMLFFLILFIYGIIQGLYSAFDGKKWLCYEKWSHTKLVSTIMLPDEVIQTKEECNETEKE